MERGNPVVRATGRAILDVPGDIAAIEEAVERAVEFCAPAGLERHLLRFNFRVGLTEALSNAILFGAARTTGRFASNCGSGRARCGRG